MSEKTIFTFHYDLSLTRKLRDAINEKRNLSEYKEGKLKEKNENVHYLAFDRICSIMDRLDDTIDYVNGMALGNCRSFRSAFDFFDFINCAYVIIDCIKTIGQIFDLEKTKMKEIEETQDVFGDVLDAGGTDGLFFEYIRSLCAVHPICTNKKTHPYIKGALFHCCPFVMWKNKNQSAFYGRDGDLIVYIYTSRKGDSPIYLSLFVNQFERYLGKWIELIPSVIECVHNYNNEKYCELKNERISLLSDFNNDIVCYLSHLKKEYIRRFGEGSEDYLNDCVRIFSIHLSNPKNEIKLQKYKNAILYSLHFLHHALQNMSFDGYENNGLNDPRRDFDLFSLVIYPPFSQNTLGIEPYNLQKVYYLQSDANYTLYDKQYARRLIDEEKEKINKVVFYSGQESDEETLVLIQLAKYLISLTFKNSLNRNIPNEEQYREKLLSTDELKELEEDRPPFSSGEKLEDILNKYNPNNN